LDAYKAKFGDQWAENLTKNLRPSPIKDIAEYHGVPVKSVRDIKHKIWMIGRIISALNESIQREDVAGTAPESVYINLPGVVLDE